MAGLRQRAERLEDQLVKDRRERMLLSRNVHTLFQHLGIQPGSSSGGARDQGGDDQGGDGGA